MSHLFRNKLVLLGTGGTIAGLASDASDNVGYTSAQVGIQRLLETVPPSRLPRADVVCEQVAQVDSKDMGFAVWQALAQRCLFWLADPGVAGIVVLHGTDTVEETAYFLHAVLTQAGPLAVPVVLTGAMRPASALSPDGPQNLLDALDVAASCDARGVTVVFAGTVHGALDVQKVQPYRLDAFDSGEAGPVGFIEEGVLRVVRAMPAGPAMVPTFGLVAGAGGDNGWIHSTLLGQQGCKTWPRVEIVTSHAGASGFMVDAMLAHGEASVAPLRGIVAAGSGNGSLHQDLEAALRRALARSVVVVRASRCYGGRIVGNLNPDLPDSGGLSPVKARIALMLALVRASGASPSASAWAH